MRRVVGGITMMGLRGTFKGHLFAIIVGLMLGTQALLAGMRLECADHRDLRPREFAAFGAGIAGAQGFALSGCFSGSPGTPVTTGSVGGNPVDTINVGLVHIEHPPLTCEERTELADLDAHCTCNAPGKRDYKHMARHHYLRDKRDLFDHHRQEMRAFVDVGTRHFAAIGFELAVLVKGPDGRRNPLTVHQDDCATLLPRPWRAEYDVVSMNLVLQEYGCRMGIAGTADGPAGTLSLHFMEYEKAPCGFGTLNLVAGNGPANVMVRGFYRHSLMNRPPWHRWMKPGREDDGTWDTPCDGGQGNDGGGNNGGGNAGNNAGNNGGGNGGGHGNNGVGNGIDPAPPGNPPPNDGSGTGPGNPGNRGGTPGNGSTSSSAGNNSGGAAGNAGGNNGGDQGNHGGGHGNNGVGNGIDPAPPGNPPTNDGSGTGPGNPGNKGGTPGSGRPNGGAGGNLGGSNRNVGGNVDGKNAGSAGGNNGGSNFGSGKPSGIHNGSSGSTNRGTGSTGHGKGVKGANMGSSKPVTKTATKTATSRAK